ncbi:MAG TPA: polyprenyl synthetase family protein [Bacteroidales bacterium]|jgi:octaprenyl-diphosphate synthase|nr:polyprenyl synthetase family protein [Bacteroidales bacterium]NLV38806.1 polyprenyl synthetase family protein [Bacteroidales bacterium]HNZ80916.1 polyprenyl synthetase family protein [Bacteroidales bacterium]HPB35596.1 polyprenyl synthetase family protein [Bacteroidales bacterium]HQN87144.1 polyprenyl synthetase family protein [Bacteroidales bacterium]
MIDLIRRPIHKEFLLYQETYKKALEPENPILSEVVQYLNGSLGKEIRPTVLLLSSAMFGPVEQTSINIAASLQILHTASLLHDDVIDETYQRRSKNSINAIWKNKVAILSGDYYLTKVIEIAALTGRLDIITEIGKLGASLADGELVQLHVSQQQNPTEAIYFDIINKKTAQLFAFCAKAGAMASSAKPEAINRLALFGEYLGIIFQLKDDSFDYILPGQSGEIPGKPVANDLKEGKVTLPLIYALGHSDEKKSRPYREIMAKRHFTKYNVRRMYRFAIESGGLDYLSKKMEEYKQKAEKILAEFPPSDAKDSLNLCLEYAANRCI